ncbi:hydroxypyruvate isomerase family protein [Kibdelosporangium phytohabitans]|uniref:Hydroxypyruvate isomerase n=1 Tax=Kibdelosporangium phytohabitans TaxID=860235 RepID=A0A0N7F4E7_9PSEU|nr:TIM barrel protein [Kibdelosporangium phytohabitans]ALG11223.1 hydroxypyruvate isomerase [Kibdelosporangium phytohabitans]MBE1462495.1 hydroxypyruvate isomerase [Kibdelosporangium phytohabitans]
MDHRFRYDVNLSILFTELDVHSRAAAAKAAGFTAAEFWWPFDVPVPKDSDVDAFVRSVRDEGVRLVGLNFFAGDMPAGERGVLSAPARTTQFRENIEVAVEIAGQLGCRAFNALYGNRIDGIATEQQDEVARENLVVAAKAASRIGATILIEPLSGAPAYPLKTAAEALAVIQRVRADGGVDNVSLLADLYHLAVNGDDPAAVIDNHAARFGHVQIADAPGRNEPGTGGLDFADLFERLADNGYDGHIGLEYKPSGASADSFDWLARDLRA